jgi:hypothetical protein
MHMAESGEPTSNVRHVSCQLRPRFSCIWCWSRSFFQYFSMCANLKIPMSTMPRHMLVSSAKGNVKALHRCNNVNLQILGKGFLGQPHSGGFWGHWCGTWNQMVEIQYAKKSVLLTSLDGEQIEIVVVVPSTTRCSVHQLDGKSLEDI